MPLTPKTRETIDALRPDAADLEAPEFRELAAAMRQDEQVRLLVERSRAMDRAIRAAQAEIPVPQGLADPAQIPLYPQRRADVMARGRLVAPGHEELVDSLAARSTCERLAYLTPIQPSGPGAPIYGVHVIGNNGSFYQPLSDRLGADQPVFGVAISRPDEHTPSGVEEVAAIYVDEIQRHRPDGPVVIAGISLAGFVAFEVARQLIEAGREVLLVVLLDAAGPGGERSVGLAKRIAIHLKRLRGGGIAHLRSLAVGLVGSARQMFWTARVRAQRLLGRPTPESLWVHRFVLANVSSVEGYEARPCSSRLLVVHAADEEFDDPEVVRAGFGWGPYAAGGIEVIEVPGDHMSILEEPNVGILADEIRASIATATRMPT